MDWGANARLVSCTNSLLFSLPKKRGQHAMLCRATWLQGWSEEEEENMPKSLYCGVRGRNRWDRSSGLGRASLNISGFPGGSDGKESTCNVGDLGSIAGLERSPGGGHDNPLQYSCLENPHGQRNLVGYSPWGCKELDVTEQLSTARHRYFLVD